MKQNVLRIQFYIEIALGLKDGDDFDVLLYARVWPTLINMDPYCYESYNYRLPGHSKHNYYRLYILNCPT